MDSRLQLFYLKFDQIGFIDLLVIVLSFFSFFQHYVRIDIVANSVEGNNENYLEWVGFVESKLFILLNLLAKEEPIKTIRAYPASFKNKELAELGLMDAEIGKY